MLWAGQHGGLEIRQSNGEAVIFGRFPYNAQTTLSDGGRYGAARKEVIASRAFAARIESGEDVHFLAGHDFEKPLASRSAGTLELNDTKEALTFEARIAPQMRNVSYVQDFLGAMEANLIKGVSPGFRLSAQDRAESVRTQDGAIVRTVKAADLFEISAVTRPAYPQAQIEARLWIASNQQEQTGLSQALARWRA